MKTIFPPEYRGYHHTEGIRQNLFELYYFEKLHATRARGARARTRRARESRWGEPIVDNSAPKLKIRLTGALGNLLLFPQMGRGTCESKYPWRKVEIIIAQYSSTWQRIPPVSVNKQFSRTFQSASMRSCMAKGSDLSFAKFFYNRASQQLDQLVHDTFLNCMLLFITFLIV